MNKALKTHCFAKVLSMQNEEYSNYVMDFFDYNLSLDTVGFNNINVGDITSDALFRKAKVIQAQIISKSDGFISGLEEIAAVLEFFELKFKFSLKDGDKIKVGQVLFTIKGEVKTILMLERTLLNFLQRMSGITTMAKKFSTVAGKTLVAPTRKTLWGLLDKKACVVGGAGTHRLNLADAVLVKDTHLSNFDGDIGKVFQLLLDSKNLGRFCEIEVESLAQASEVAKLCQKFYAKFTVPFVLMLDNMKVAEIKKIVNIFKKSPILAKVILEASGGINLKNLKSYCETGVDVVSIGALTHSVQALDFSMKIF